MRALGAEPSGRQKPIPHSPVLVPSAVSREVFRQPDPHEIPMPCVAALAGAGVLEWFELEAAFRQPDGVAVFHEARSVRRHEVRHLLSLPHMTVEPEPTVHRVDHSIATRRELQILDSALWPIHSRMLQRLLLTGHDAVGRCRRERSVADEDVAANRVRHDVLRLRVPTLPGRDSDRDRHPV